MYRIINGIVLNRTNFSEYDKIVTLYTLELGKIKCFFKSVNKPKAKLIYFTEPATEVELKIVKVKNKNYAEFFKAAGGVIVNSNVELRKNLEIYIYTCKILNLVDATTLELLKDEDKFFLIKRIFEVLPTAKSYQVMYYAFVYRFIKLSGYTPQIDRCGLCKNNLKENGVFNILNGFIICDKCVSKVKENSGIFKISINTIKLVQSFYKLNAQQINNLEINKQVLDELKYITDLYLQNFIYKPLLNI